MARLVYSTIASVDGFVADRHGRFDWAEPDEELHGAANDLARPIGTYLLGRRMYEVLRIWDALPIDGEPDEIAEYAALWRGSDKVVYSGTLDGVSTARTHLERSFDPDAVAALARDAAKDVSIGGPTLAATALRAGIVDELQLIRVPRVVGGGTAVLPPDLDLRLELLEDRRFRSGATLTRYAIAR